MHGRKHTGRLLAWLLSLMVACAMMPAAVFAEEPGAEGLTDDATGDDTTGDETVDDETSEDDTTDDDIPEDNTAGDDTTDDDTTGDDASDDGTTDDDITEDVTAGDDTTGDDVADDDTTGDDTVDDDTAGDDSTDDDTTDGDAADNDTAGGDIDDTADDTAADDDTQTTTSSKTKRKASSVSEETAVAQIGDTTYTTLEAAVSAASSGDTVTLLGNYTTDGYIYVSTDITLDLDGYTLTFTGTYYSIYVAGSSAKLTLQNGKVEDTAKASGYETISVYNGASLATEDVTITTTSVSSGMNYIIYMYTYSGGTQSVTLGSGTVLQSSGDSDYYGTVGVAVMGCGSDTSATSGNTLNVSGATISTNGYAIVGNGSVHGTTITISDSTLTSTAAPAIYHPQNGTMTITDSTITGYQSGIEIRAGSVTISDSTITATMSDSGASDGTGGTTVYGAGIAISQHSTNLAISVTLTDCTVTGTYAVYEEDVEDETATDQISLTINSGTYTSIGSDTTAVYSENMTAFIVSGTFSSDSDTDIEAKYVASSSVAATVSSTGRTYVGTNGSGSDSISSILADVVSDGDTVTIVGTGSNSSVNLTGLDGVTVKLDEDLDTSAAVTVNDVTVTTEGVVTHPDAVHVAAADPTCTEDGNIEYWYCEDCGQYFADEDCQEEITDLTTLVSAGATGHTWSADDVQWTWTKSGDTYTATATFTCSVCGAEETVTATVTSEVSDDTTVYTATAADPDGGETCTATLTVTEEEESTTDSSSSDSSSSSSSSSTTTTTAETTSEDAAAAFTDVTDATANAYNALLANTEEELAALVLTEEEQALVASGVSSVVYLEVVDITDITDTVAPADKALVESVKGDSTVGVYLDISLYKKINGDEAVKVTETNGGVSITLTLSGSLINTDQSVARTYQVVRVHDGAAEILPCTYNALTAELTFETDRFSTYAVIYTDAAVTEVESGTTDVGGREVPSTGDEGNLILWLALLLASGAALGGVLYLGSERRRRA